jgi:hypothetical protein
VNGTGHSRVIVLVRGERVEVELDQETFGRVCAAVEAAKEARRSALGRAVRAYLRRNPEATANEVADAVYGRRQEILRAVRAARAAGAASATRSVAGGDERPVPEPGTGSADEVAAAGRA